ncbi:MAG TPA: cytidylate kinase-like family protein, partial [Anaerolineaceae bacterium]|nr:cytidylate kinase-like family protein [Anaerolineaceae bacterium]
MAVITISRQFGSGGDQIASRVCQMLGYRYFDKRLIASVAAETGLSSEDVVDYSEEQHQVQSFLGRLFNRARPVGEVRVWREDTLGERTAEVERLDQARATGMVQLAIQKAYLQGNVVIVGRGGQVILKDKPDVLHVRIEAPFDDRVQRVKKLEGVTQGFAFETVL